MPDFNLKKILKRLNLQETWLIFFVLGNVMLNFPFLRIFNRSSTIFGFPLTYLYFTIGWAISIGVIYLFVCSSDTDEDEQQDDRQSTL